MSFYSPPRFFKIIQNHELQNGSELRVPKKFVEKYWKGIPNPAVITLPNGVQQQLFWVKRDGDILFQKNWEKFAKFLKFGYAVVFKYYGGSCFHLEIFGLNSLEIDYSTIKFIDGIGSNDDDDDSDESEIHRQSQKTKKGKRKMNMDFGGMNKKAKKCRTAETNVASTSSQRRKSGTDRGGVTNSNNPSFEVRLTPTSAQGYNYSMPTEFSRKYMKGFEGKAILRVVGDEDRIWKLRVKYNCVRKYCTVTSGWQSFTKENNLQIGDVCKFEMIQTKPLTFTVTIIRVREEPRPNQFQDLEGPNAYTFKFVVNTLYPCVPKRVFSRRDGEECHGKFVELKVGGKSWYVRLHCQSRGIRFYKGWSKFKEECLLEIGDTCFFEVIDAEKLVFEVSFERKKP